MNENTVVGKLVTGGDPQMLSREIINALAESEKFGYDAIFEETTDPDDQLTITFTRSGKNQALVIPVGSGDIEVGSGRPSSTS